MRYIVQRYVKPIGLTFLVVLTCLGLFTPMANASTVTTNNVADIAQPATVTTDPPSYEVVSFVSPSDCALPLGTALLRQDYPANDPQLDVVKQVFRDPYQGPIPMNFRQWHDPDPDYRNDPQKNCAGWTSSTDPTFVMPRARTLDTSPQPAPGTPRIVLSGGCGGEFSAGLLDRADSGSLTNGEVVITDTRTGQETRYPTFYLPGGTNDRGPCVSVSTLRE